MHTQLTTTQWLGLPSDVRRQLVETFGIPRSQGTHIQDNDVISDGYTHEDLAHITVPVMQMYLNSKETDFFVLFHEVLDELPVLHDQTEPIVSEIVEVKADGVVIDVVDLPGMEIKEVVITEVVKKRGRPAKK
jgi:hypothetical protein